MSKYKSDFLLEINVEELPAGYVRPALKSMRTAFLYELELNRISDKKKTVPAIENPGTKNKLICHIRNIPLQQEEVCTEIIGPPKRIAFDEKGNPTKQAIGFAKNQGVKVGDLKIKSTPKGEYVIIERKEKVRRAKDILREITPAIIKEIRFPKTMRWDDSGLRFARPIESMLVLFGKENLDIKLGNIPQKKIAPMTPEQYLKKIKLIDSDERKREIRRLILKELKKLKAGQDIGEALLEEATFMINSPSVFVGEFDKEFLTLPGDVLKASMAKHQRIFPVLKNGKLINKFIAVIDGKRKIKLVRKNYENILDAKLKDSLFFFEEDTKKPFSENIFLLKDLIFQKDLGNMFEKIERLKGLCSFICEKINVDSSLKNDAVRAAELSKADLVSHMVGEFPSLQGIMGREYALRSGEKKEVSEAIGEHYLPQRAEDNLPKSLAGAVLSIADKIDNLTGFLGMGAEISGSFDPFGIRRNALGLIYVIKDRGLRFNMEDLIQKAIELHGDKLKVPAVQLKRQVVVYMKDKIEFLMRDIMPTELVKAVLESGCFDIVGIFKRKKDIAHMKTDVNCKRYFLQTAKVVERTSNILKGAKGERIGEVDSGLFKEDLERELWSIYLNSKDKIKGFIEEEDYKEATRKYAKAFFEVLNRFFDNVLVNTKDSSLRENRLAMMQAINKLYTNDVADLAMLPQIIVK